jgi:hypothetical protein
LPPAAGSPQDARAPGFAPRTCCPPGHSGWCASICTIALNGLEQLEQLDLSESPLTDEQLAQLTAAPALGQLNLSETSVTDAGLKALHAFKSLNRVELPARASDAAIAELKAALPECQAVR